MSELKEAAQICVTKATKDHFTPYTCIFLGLENYQPG
jgi:hypothetical protein